jgi:hypothetical protein
MKGGRSNKSAQPMPGERHGFRWTPSARHGWPHRFGVTSFMKTSCLAIAIACFAITIAIPADYIRADGTENTVRRGDWMRANGMLACLASGDYETFCGHVCSITPVAAAGVNMATELTVAGGQSRPNWKLTSIPVLTSF